MRTLRLAISVLASVTVAAGLVGVAAPAEAAKPRCTIVGTSGDDILVGTRGRDVICGLGGDDTIRGRRGNDIIRGGRGADRIEDGYGADRVFGGLGADKLLSIEGNTTPVEAGDVLRGGRGGDRIDSRSRDVAYGGLGDDDIFGLHLRGGPGNDYCFNHVSRTLEGINCEDDGEPPAIENVTLSATELDVTDEEAILVIRAHITDDIGARLPIPWLTIADPDGGEDIRYGGLFSGPELVSGDRRDGVWRMKIIVGDFAPTGDYALTIEATSRGAGDDGLPMTVWDDATVRVTNDND